MTVALLVDKKTDIFKQYFDSLKFQQPQVTCHLNVNVLCEPLREQAHVKIRFT